MVRTLEPVYSPARLEREVRRFWDRNRVYERARRRPGRPFFFVDGPPYTTGAIHLGTAWNKVLKDAVLRHRTMAGFRVSDTPGWDMHGLPIEVKVEEELGFTSKKQIEEELGVGKFVHRCKEFAEKNRKKMTRQFERLGVWMDWKNPYRTVTPEYMEAAWSTLKEAHKRGLLEQNYRVVNQCPRCETALAEAEIEYETITDPSIYVKFPLVDRPGASLLIWTTTPWTLPGNMAVAVHPDLDYAEVQRGQETIIVASPLIEKIPGLLDSGGRVVAKRPGHELVGWRYRHPVPQLLALDAHPLVRQNPPPYSVLAADFVQTTEGTGCVHIAPVYGEDDYWAIRRWAQENRRQVEFFYTVDGRGQFTNLVPSLMGQDFRKGNRVIVDGLRQAGTLFHEEQVSHRYGHCWRCKSPLLFLATDQWFLKVSRLRDEMKAEAAKARWVPDWAGASRFADFIGEARDWCISRQRYWGIPLPIWRCEKCNRAAVVGTRQELQTRSGRKVADIHRPSVDPLTWPCSKGCGGTMKRVPDIFDVWFDSAVASWAIQGWPGRKKEEGKNRPSSFIPRPSSFICEGHDQTRGWFFSQLAASVAAFGCAPYETVLMHGFTLDEAGRKMSKSLGNVIEPGEVADRFGADALRWAVLSASAPWEDLRFSMAQAEAAYRSLNILYNTVRFLGGAGVPSRAPKGLRVEDRWLLSRLQATVAGVSGGLESFHLHKAARALQGFWEEDLSRWYIPLVRRRLGEGDPAAAWTLAAALDATVRLLSPFAPFLAERLYLSLPGRKAQSVHLAPWPKVEGRRRRARLEEAMAVARRAVEAAWRARQRLGRKLRWPVARVTVVTPARRDLADLRAVLREQANAKEVVLLEPGAPLPDREAEVRPLPGKIGPAFRQRAQEVIEALKRVRPVPPGARERGLEIDVGGEKITVGPGMFELVETTPEGVATEPFEGGQVVVDGRLTPELEAEGWAREVVRRVQETRKGLGLTPAARVAVSLDISDPRVAEVLSKPPWAERIASGVRASRLTFGKAAGKAKEWDLEEWRLAVSIRK